MPSRGHKKALKLCIDRRAETRLDLAANDSGALNPIPKSEY